jgi:predicted RNase H-like nuclease
VVAGVDGCRAGWLMVRLAADGAVRLDIARQFGDLPLRGLAMVAVDMPIGLPDSGARACDGLARALLPAERRASVFLHLRRPLLAQPTLAAANRWARRDGKAISVQAWNILPRIADLDSWITPARQRRVRESHPELVFLTLNAGAPLPKKRTAAGMAARRAVLRRHGLAGLESLEKGLRRRDAARDDLYDAAALALAARRFALGQGTRLAGGRDARGLRMEIWY